MSSLRQWLAGGTDPEYERGEAEIVPRQEPQPPSWGSRNHEASAFYQADTRIRHSATMAVHGVDAIKAIHDHINSKGGMHPALETELRAVEQALALCVPYLVSQYMRDL